MKNLYIGLIGCALTAAACSGSDSNSVKESIKQGIKSTDLAHKWIEDQCRSIPLASAFNLGGSEKLEYEFSGNNVTKIEHHYKNADCTDEANKTIYSGTFKKEKDADTGENIYKLTMTFDKVKVNPLTQNTVDDYVKNQTCGRTDWAVGKENEVTQSTSCPVKTLPKTVNQIYTVDGDRLLLGIDNENDSEKRPAEIDRKNSFRKQ